MDRYLLNEIKHISNSMFQKNYFGVFHGSISARTSVNSFIINRKKAILDEMEEEDFIELNCVESKDYRWHEASTDVDIHEQIYRALPNAKYIAYTMPPFATAYSLTNTNVIPQDYYGFQTFNEVSIYDPKNYHDWNERAADEITTFFQNSTQKLLLIRGFGVLSYHRDLTEMVKNIAVLENSCKLLTMSSIIK